MCNMDILILIRDREMDKIFQYSSGQTDGADLFTVDTAMKNYYRLSKLNGKIKVFNDSDYEELKILYNRNSNPKVRGVKEDQEDSGT